MKQYIDPSFLDFFKKFKGLNLKDIYDLYKISKLIKVKSGEHIVRSGDMYPYSLGVLKGVVRTYVITTAGEEKTTLLTSERKFTGAANCILYDQPSFEFLEAVEDCRLIAVNMREFRNLTQDNIRLLHLFNDNILEAFGEAIHRIQFFVTLNPEERYLQILDEAPELINRVPQKYLASYIGVTTVSLSRIRSRIRKS